MSYSQFIMAILAIYVVYYAANILYDALLKQSKVNAGEEEGIISIREKEEIPHNVVDEDFGTGLYEKEEEKNEFGQNCVSVNKSIEMEVGTQGVPMEQLLAKGKNMFSHINFSKQTTNFYPNEKVLFKNYSKSTRFSH